MTTPRTTTQETGPAAIEMTPAAPPSKALRKRSLAAVGRSATGDRSLAILVGLVLLAAGALVALLSYGVFGTARAGRPLLDPMIVDAMRSQPLLARIIAIVAGLLLAVLGLTWAARSVRPERRPDVVVESGADTSIVVSATAAADAVAGQAAELPGVGRARARLVGPPGAPALRVTLWLADDAVVSEVLRRLESEVLVAARDSLGLAALPVAVRLELDGVTATRRVS
ncbi:alkaline shock response membrane anchor protein AmaP [Pseudonocardia sp. GCM10023141]|uniref:alkaline shock response membrane anchor protein AmaP n=1 Tax=Pseudonocardia sp. GCM10023141 TaxID=3252653 RepID=UPI0036167C06